MMVDLTRCIDQRHVGLSLMTVVPRSNTDTLRTMTARPPPPPPSPSTTLVAIIRITLKETV